MEDFTSLEKRAIREKLVMFSSKLIGILYEYGYEWKNFKNIPEFLDCSEIVEGIYNHIGLKMPDGSQNQFDFTVPVSTYDIGDLVFFGRGGKSGQIYHSGMIYDKDTVIECRGYDPKCSFETGKVILGVLSKWMGFNNYCGIRSHPRLI